MEGGSKLDDDDDSNKVKPEPQRLLSPEEKFNNAFAEALQKMPKPAEKEKESTRALVMFRVDGDYNNFDTAGKWEAMQKELQLMSGDESLAVLLARPGSVIVAVKVDKVNSAALDDAFLSL